jgi:large subunit ribosomal protein L24
MQRLKVSDVVEVISGNNKGAQGKILRFTKKGERAVVEKVAMVKKHMKPSQNNPAGGIVEKERSLHVSNLMLVDPTTKKPGRVGIKTVDGKKARVFKKSGSSLA